MVRGVWNEFARKLDATWKANAEGDLMPAAVLGVPGRRGGVRGVPTGTPSRGCCGRPPATAGTKFLRRMMGIVSVWDITSIEDPEKRAVAEKAAIRIGMRWLLDRGRVTSVDDLIRVVREELPPG